MCLNRSATLFFIVVLCAYQSLSFAQSNAKDKAAHEPVRAKIINLKKTLLSSGITTDITNINGYVGNRIKKGDTLVALNCVRYKAAKTIALANVKSAKARYKSAKELLSFNSVGPLEVTLSEAELSKVRGEYQAANAEVGECTVKAPYDAVIAKRFVEPHQYINRGEPLLEIHSLKKVEIHLVVPSNWLTWLSLKTPFTITLDETQQKYQGHVSRVSGIVDPVSQTIEVFGSFEHAKDYDETSSHQILSGMSGWVHFDETQ